MRTRSWLLPVLSATVAVVAAFLLVAADRYLARTAGLTGATEAVVPVLVVLAVSSVVMIVVVAVLEARQQPYVPALPVPAPGGVLAWLAASLVLAVVALGSVREAGGESFAPALTGTAAALAFAVGLVAFVRHTRAIAWAAHPYAAVSRLGEVAVEAADRRYPARIPAEAPEVPLLQVGRVVPAPRTGYVVSVDVPRLARDALSARSIVTVPPVGAFVIRGEPLIKVHADDGRQLPRRIAGGVRIADVRDPRQDVAHDLGLLSDVAVGALASQPGVAEAALDRIGEVLARLGPRPFPHGRFADADGDLRVVQPVLSWARLAEIALADIALRGGADPRVRERLAALVLQLRRRLAPERAAALVRYTPEPPFTHPVERRVPVQDLERPAVTPGGAGGSTAR